MKQLSTLRRRSFLKSAIGALGLVVAAPVLASDSLGWGIREESYADVLHRVLAMPSDGDLQARAARYGLNVVNVMWEDTGRFEGSSVGPNISDLTLQVREKVKDRDIPADAYAPAHLLPVLRYPNFEDTTADVKMDKIWVRVGNQHKGSQLVAVPLKEILRNMREYLGDPSSLKGSDNFLAERDSHVLVSAQHVFVPVPKGGVAEFNPVLFNYQSAPGHPAVLTLLVTREGTSAQVIENRGDDQLGGWGQQLFFNNKGQRTLFTAERKSDVKERIESGHAKPTDAGALEEGADMVMIIQVPLKVAQPRRLLWGEGADLESAMPGPPMAPSAKASTAPRGRSDVEEAVIGHGEDMGKFIEMNGLKLKRDGRFPIRVTVQLYKATSNGVVSDQDLADCAAQIDKVYKSGDFVGSLVVPQGERTRPTDWLKGRTKRSS